MEVRDVIESTRAHACTIIAVGVTALACSLPGVVRAQDVPAGDRRMITLPLVASDTGPVADTVLALTTEFNAALRRGDSTTLVALSDPRCVQITSSGIATRDEWLSPFWTGAKKLGSGTTSAWRRVRLFGSVATITTNTALEMQVSGVHRSFHVVTTRVWARADNGWRLVVAQNTLVTADSARAAQSGGVRRVVEERSAPIAGAEGREALAANRRVEVIDLQPDSAAAWAMYADDFLNVTANGDVRDKVSRLTTLLSREPRYEAIADSGVRVLAFDGAAVVTGRSHVRARMGGVTRDGVVLFTRVFARRGGDWRLVLQQLTRPALSADQQRDLLVGTWTTDVARSTAAPGPMRFARWMSRIERVPEGYRVIGDGMLVSGKAVHSVALWRMDGQAAATIGDEQPATYTWNSVDRNTFDLVRNDADGTITTRSVISPDGSMRVNFHTRRDAQGHIMQTVLEVMYKR